MRFKPSGIRPTVCRVPCGKDHHVPDQRAWGSRGRSVRARTSSARAPRPHAARVCVDWRGRGAGSSGDCQSMAHCSDCRPCDHHRVEGEVMMWWASGVRAAVTSGRAARTSSPSGSCQGRDVSTASANARSMASGPDCMTSSEVKAAMRSAWVGRGRNSASSPEVAVSSTRELPFPGSKSWASQNTADLTDGSSSVTSCRHRRRPRGPANSTSAPIFMGSPYVRDRVHRGIRHCGGDWLLLHRENQQR
jgi:hypothetical protein